MNKFKTIAAVLRQAGRPDLACLVLAAKKYGVIVDWGGGDFTVEPTDNLMQAVKMAKQATKENKGAKVGVEELDHTGAPFRSIWPK